MKRSEKIIKTYFGELEIWNENPVESAQIQFWSSKQRPQNWEPNSHGRPPLLGSRATCRKRTLQWHRSLEWSSFFSFSFTLFLCFLFFLLIFFLFLVCILFPFLLFLLLLSLLSLFFVLDGLHFGELSWRVSHPNDPASGRHTCCTHPTDSIHSILSAGRTNAKCLEKCQWDGTWHKDA